MNDSPGWVNEPQPSPLIPERRKLIVNAQSTAVKKILQISVCFQKEILSSNANNNPPTDVQRVSSMIHDVMMTIVITMHWSSDDDAMMPFSDDVDGDDDRWSCHFVPSGAP